MFHIVSTLPQAFAMFRTMDVLRCSDRILCLVFCWVMSFGGTAMSQIAERPQESIDFGLQIRPILAEHCFHCHGPDPAHREADLRLDEESEAKRVLGGSAAIVPGNLTQSELWNRIQSSDPESVMPPPSARKSLSEDQKALLSQWIESGATWGAHWSLSPLTRTPLPETARDPWVQSPIDAWALHGMVARGLSPAPKADATTLARRLHLDLLGVPPTGARVQQFVQDFEKDRKVALRDLVDELLQRPEYGEHWARLWLDLARYADTKGYEKDLPRDMWPYRDWVIEAFQRDMPFDQFSLEQLAGDLITDRPDALVATAFHRATLSNDEGGTDDEEFRVAAVKDRVDTTLQVWMGLTAGCAKCHSHKYDPISMEDYYRIYAIFNQTEDADRYDDEPRLSLPNAEQKSALVALESDVQDAKQRLEKARQVGQAEIASAWTVATPVAAQSTSGRELILEADRTVRAMADRPEKDTYTIAWTLPAGEYHAIKLDALLAQASPDEPAPRLGLNAADPNFVLSELTLEQMVHAEEGHADEVPIELHSPRASFEQSGWPASGTLDRDDATGWAVSPRQREPHWIVVAFKQPIRSAEPVRLQLTLSQQYGNRLLLHRVQLSAIGQSDQPLTADELPLVQAAAEAAKELEARLAALKGSIPRLPVLRELPDSKRRITKLHQRGSFLDLGEEVYGALPKLFPTPLTQITSPNRLHLAKWLFDDANPLTARVMVNRIWAQLYGRGLVETEEDFGSQGAMPMHPEILDTLAYKLQHEFGWSQKRLLKEIVLSSTYQQAFVLDEARRERDPRNDWLSRSSRFRLSAEVIRDQALAVSGLLSDRRGGPPVMPPQPEGLWRSTYSGARWVTSLGPDRYRRGLYTYWKRTTPYPSMETFDATTREVCQIRRISTNTPLQALVTLNDPVFTEASIAMARLWLRSASSDSERLRWGYYNTLGRPVREVEVNALTDLLQRARAHYSAETEAASEFLAEFPSSEPDAHSKVDLAAWSMVTSAVLNLDELLMRP